MAYRFAVWLGTVLLINDRGFVAIAEIEPLCDE